MPEKDQKAAVSQPAVEVEDLKFGYGTAPVIAIERFRLEQSETCALIGPSGCGKSTFVHLLAGLLTAVAGSVKILGQDLAGLSETERDRFRGRHVGFVFQRFHLMPALSVRENLIIAQRLARAERSSTHIDALLERLGLGGLDHRKPGALSQGQAQRAALARALVHKPELVIADEPTSALDDDNAKEALALLGEVAAESGAALLIVTHDHRVRGHLSRDFDMSAPT